MTTGRINQITILDPRAPAFTADTPWPVSQQRTEDVIWRGRTTKSSNGRRRRTGHPVKGGPLNAIQLPPRNFARNEAATENPDRLCQDPPKPFACPPPKGDT